MEETHGAQICDSCGNLKTISNLVCVYQHVLTTETRLSRIPFLSRRMQSTKFHPNHDSIAVRTNEENENEVDGFRRACKVRTDRALQVTIATN